MCGFFALLAQIVQLGSYIYNRNIYIIIIIYIIIKIKSPVFIYHLAVYIFILNNYNK